MNFFIFNSDIIKKIFFIIVIAVFIIIASAYWFTRLYFTRTGDLLPIEDAASFVLRHGKDDVCIYSNLVTSNTDDDFKFSLLKNVDVDPQVVFLGSSRVLEYFQPMFRVPLLNMGRGMQFPQASDRFINMILKRKSMPKFVFIGVDFWWFSKNYMERVKSNRYKLMKVAEIDPESIYQIRSLIKRSLKQPYYFSFMSDFFNMPNCPLGIPAKRWLTGFVADGSALYGAFSFAQYHHIEFRFEETLQKIQKGKNRLAWGKEPYMNAIDKLIEISNKLSEINIKTIFILPPLPNKVYEKMRISKKYEYISAALNMLKAKGLKIYNYLDPQILGLTDCEFIDGFHHGDVVSAMILLDLAKKDPELRPYLDMTFLKRLAANRGNAMVIFSELYNKPERDFLELGCKKEITTPLWPTPEEKQLAHKLFYTGATTDHAEDLRRLRAQTP